MGKRGPKGKGKKDESEKVGGPLQPGAGHNSELTDDQKQALWFQDHKPKLVSLKEQIASLTGDLRNQYKKVKADLGLKKADVDFALKLADDDGELVEQQRRQMMLARWEGHALGTQPDLFGDGVDRTPAIDKAFADGKRACMENQSRKPPHDPSVPQYQSWMDGYDAGQTILASAFKKLPEATHDQAH